MITAMGTSSQSFAWLGGHPPTIVAMLALALACGMLSLVVLWRRWAFLGEGVAHAGFGGAGSAWLLAAMYPALDRPVLVDAGVVIFCLVTALAIGVVHRSGKIHSDTAIGAFLAGTLAWGFLGQQIYTNAHHQSPAGFQSLLFGQMELLSWTHAQLAVAMLLVVVITLVATRKQVLLYCFDPELAQTSGVRTSLIHYTLITLIALAIISGVRLIGTVLITAMLILPGATAVMITRRLYPAVAIASLLGVAGAIAGLAVSARWPALPEGPVTVLSLFATFLLVWAGRGSGKRE
jgi:ABC-type Mn2+/Zn2+ transport system permease subunit